MTSKNGFILMVLLLLVKISASHHTCKTNEYCTCMDEFSNKYEINCNRSGQVVNIKVTAGEVAISCDQFIPSNENPWSKIFENLDIGGVGSVIFKHCPSVPEPFHKIFQHMNINSVKYIYFNAYQKNEIKFSPEHFENLTNIISLHLNNNGLKELHRDTFEGVKNLNSLYLFQNNLTHIDPEIFQYIPKLKTLDIGNNKITNLDQDTFKFVPDLIHLNIYSNKLNDTLNRDIFRNIKNIQALDLSNNGITKLEPHLFDDLPALRILNLNFNNITEIPEGIFGNNYGLSNVRFNYDLKSPKLPSRLFANLTSLENLTLMYNNLSSLPENLLQKTYKLNNLMMKKNFLETLPNDIFKDNYLLKELDISYNKLKHLNGTVFTSLGSLVKLSLNNNQLSFIPRELFSNMTKLEYLRLENNKLSTIQYGAFFNLKNVKIVDMSQNALSFEDDRYLQSPFSKCNQLEELHLTNNTISMIFDDWLRSLSKLHLLKLNYNSISQIQVEDVQFVYPVEVDLSYNKIETIDISSLEKIAWVQCDKPPCLDGGFHQTAIRITLEGNPIICDCRSYHLARYFQHKMAEYVYKYIWFNHLNVTCSTPDYFKNSSIKSVDIHDLICSWDKVESATKTNCTDKCNCYYRPADNAAIANCSNANLTELPKILPFGHFINHTEIILTNNQIKNLSPIAELSIYRNVTKFYLSCNKIKHVNAMHISPKLQVLEIDNNLITHLSNETIKALNKSSNLERITLHNNPWRCDCDTQYLLYFMQERFNSIPYLQNITCDLLGTPIIKMLVDDLCSTSLSIIIASASVAAMGILLGASVAFYYRYQHEIRVWLFAHKICLWLVAEKELDRDKKYDAFVSYSHLDEELVIDHLVPNLEKCPNPFKLCLHFRDFIAGEWIPNQIIKSVEDSRRTLVVLSPNFLNSVWGKMEFRTAHLKAIKDGCARVIIILYKDIDTEKLDAELKAYLSMNTYVKWGDPWFWSKLRYALPHPPEYCKQLPISKVKGKSKKQKMKKKPKAYNKTKTAPTEEMVSNHEDKIVQLNKLYSQKV